MSGQTRTSWPGNHDPEILISAPCRYSADPPKALRSIGVRETMIEILRTNDAVALSLAEALLQGAGIECFVADRHMSALEGSIGAFQRRVLVDPDVEIKARRTLVEGGLGAYLREGPA